MEIRGIRAAGKMRNRPLFRECGGIGRANESGSLWPGRAYGLKLFVWCRAGNERDNKVRPTVKEGGSSGEPTSLVQAFRNRLIRPMTAMPMKT